MSIIEGVRFGRAETAPGITLRYAEMGDGPLVLLAHGFPESWYNWRHQMPALAAAGFRGVAPDIRGYGGSSRPSERSRTSPCTRWEKGTPHPWK